MQRVLLGAVLVCAPLCPAATPRAALNGVVLDGFGKPLANTTVMIYHAGVKSGYSIFCPSCYADCGRRVLTDSQGRFEIGNLAPDLWFSLLTVRDGYVPKISKQFDPQKSADIALALEARPIRTDLRGTVRGRVVDEAGSPLPNALVTPAGLIREYKGQPSASYGTFPGLEPVAVANANGEFEVSYAEPTPKMLLEVEARGMAPKFIVEETGAARHTIALEDGATITGRVTSHGKPLPGVQIGLIAKKRGGFGGNLKVIGDPYDEVRIGTDANGRFTIPDVPEPVDWYLYGKMESVGKLGVTYPLEVHTTRDRQILRSPTLVVTNGYRVRGRVVLSDGRAVGNGMHVSLSSERVSDAQTVALRPDGTFEFQSVPAGDYSIWASVRGYQAKTDALPYDPPPVFIGKDVEGLVLQLDPKR